MTQTTTTQASQMIMTQDLQLELEKLSNMSTVSFPQQQSQQQQQQQQRTYQNRFYSPPQNNNNRSFTPIPTSPTNNNNNSNNSNSQLTLSQQAMNKRILSMHSISPSLPSNNNKNNNPFYTNNNNNNNSSETIMMESNLADLSHENNNNHANGGENDDENLFDDSDWLLDDTEELNKRLQQKILMSASMASSDSRAVEQPEQANTPAPSLQVQQQQEQQEQEHHQMMMLTNGQPVEQQQEESACASPVTPKTTSTSPTNSATNGQSRVPSPTNHQFSGNRGSPEPPKIHKSADYTPIKKERVKPLKLVSSTTGGSTIPPVVSASVGGRHAPKKNLLQIGKPVVEDEIVQFTPPEKNNKSSNHHRASSKGRRPIQDEIVDCDTPPQSQDKPAQQSTSSSVAPASTPVSSMTAPTVVVKQEPAPTVQQKNVFQTIQKMNNLAKYLDPGKDRKALYDHFGITTYQRGNEYFHDGMTWHMKLEEVMEVSDGVKLFKLTGNCWGTSVEPYAQEILLIPPTEQEAIQIQRAKCTCPVASNCKHACACVLTYVNCLEQKKDLPSGNNLSSHLKQTKDELEQLKQEHEKVIQKLTEVKQSEQRGLNELSLCRLNLKNIQSENLALQHKIKELQEQMRQISIESGTPQSNFCSTASTVQSQDLFDEPQPTNQKEESREAKVMEHDEEEEDNPFMSFTATPHSSTRSTIDDIDPFSSFGTPPVTVKKEEVDDFDDFGFSDCDTSSFSSPKKRARRNFDEDEPMNTSDDENPFEDVHMSPAKRQKRVSFNL